MLVLYVPFTKEELGDLKLGAALWKSAIKSSTAERCKIIYYQQEFDETDFEEHITVYVLAHGNSTEMKTNLYADSGSNAFEITPEILASRFLEDFLIIRTQIRDIHIYCCGIHEKNRQIAITFRKNLISQEFSHIHYYEGNLSAPDNNGQSYAFFSVGKKPVERCRSTIIRSEDGLDLQHKISLKKKTFFDWHQNKKQRHHDFNHEIRSQKREKIHMENRLQPIYGKN